jgi:CRP/FNR family transcriptional regulator
VSRQTGGDVPTRSYATGDVIFREGDEATGEAYLVHEGRLEIRKQFGSEERVLRVIGKGDLLGELALFRNAPRSATAVAAEPAVLIVIPTSRLDALVRTNPTLALALIKQLATRMLEAEDRAAQMAALLEQRANAQPR